VDFFDLVSGAIVMRPSSYSKLKIAIENLSNEEWFRELYKDSRYTTATWYNKDIKKILLVPSNIEMLKKDKEKAKQFIDLVIKSANNK
jgi:hypothetical protein